MRKARTLLIAVLMGVGLLAAPHSADAKETLFPTYAFRACWDFGSNTTRGHMCIKVYVKRQEDGQGLNSKNRHIYAWTTNDAEGTRSTNCGAAFQSPAADPSRVAVYNGLTFPETWGRYGDLNDQNSCDSQWSEDVFTNRDFQIIEWTVQPRRAFQNDGPVQHLRLSIAENMTWACTVPEQDASDYCTRTGPF